MDEYELTLEAVGDGRLEAALAAQREVEGAQRLAAIWLRVTAALGLPVWCLCLWPEALEAHSRRLILTLWAFSALAGLGSLLSRWRWSLELERQLRADRVRSS